MGREVGGHRIVYTLYMVLLYMAYMYMGASLVAQLVKHLPAMRETRVQSLEDPLEKEMATHSSTLAWKIPWMEKPGRLQSMGLQSQTRLSDFTFTFLYVYEGHLHADFK